MAATTETLIPRKASGWQSGLMNLIGNEMNLRWGGRRWIVPTLVWVAILNGIVAIVTFATAQEAGSTPAKTLLETGNVFVNMAIVAASIGAVINAQGAVIREKQMGTAAWVLSKPASRESFILAKWLTYAFSFTMLSLLIPGLVFILQSLLFLHLMPALLPLLSAWLVVVLQIQFYLALSLMLGTIFNGRGSVTGIGLGFLFGGMLLIEFMPQWLVLIFPWPLKDVATGLVMGQTLPSIWPIPVIATFVWILIFIGVSLWRFNREEF